MENNLSKLDRFTQFLADSNGYWDADKVKIAYLVGLIEGNGLCVSSTYGEEADTKADTKKGGDYDEIPF